MRDFDSIVKDKEIPWVRHWIDATFEFSKNFIKPGTTNEIDFEALGKEEWEFRKALKTKDFTSSKRAEYLWNEAIKLRDRNRANGSKGGRPKKETTADGDTREDSQAKPDGSAITRNETRAHDALEPSANNCGPRQAKNGDAPHREAGDESATVSKNFSTPTISTNRRRTGGSVREAVDPLPPVRQSEPDVMSLAYSGEFQNVRLTQEQYAELGIKFGNQQKLNRAIDSLSCKLENGETNPRNHYAELVKWASYREDMEEQKIQQSEAPKMTEMEKSWIREAEKIARYEKELASNERR